MSSTIQRSTIIQPFSTQTPFTDKKSGSVSKTHTKFFQDVGTAINNAPQITATIPANSSADGNPGTIAFDANWLYVCVGTNIWKRTALSSF